MDGNPTLQSTELLAVQLLSYPTSLIPRIEIQLTKNEYETEDSRSLVLPANLYGEFYTVQKVTNMQDLPEIAEGQIYKVSILLYN